MSEWAVVRCLASSNFDETWEARKVLWRDDSVVLARSGESGGEAYTPYRVGCICTTEEEAVRVVEQINQKIEKLKPELKANWLASGEIHRKLRKELKGLGVKVS